jgi:hypothetical protein
MVVMEAGDLSASKTGSMLTGDKSGSKVCEHQASPAPKKVLGAAHRGTNQKEPR